MIRKLILAIFLVMTLCMPSYAGDFEKSVIEIKEKIIQSRESLKMEILKIKSGEKDHPGAIDYAFSISPTCEYIAIFTIVSPSHPALSVTDINGTNRKICLYEGESAANDVESSRVVWHNEKNILYFAGSPIYGKPGIYQWDIERNKIARLVKPTNLTKYYPDGFDFFILLAISPDNKYLYYYHSPTDQSFEIQDIEHLYYVDLETKKIYKALSK